MTRYAPPELTPAQQRERDRRIRVALIEHQLDERRPFGGTATGSRMPCSCGEQNWINSTRDMALSRGRAHVATEIAKALDR